MSCVLFNVQNYISFKPGIKAVPTISHADLLHRNMRGCCFHCKISVLFFQDGSFDWGLKKMLFHFCSFLFLICTFLNVQKITG